MASHVTLSVGSTTSSPLHEKINALLSRATKGHRAICVHRGYPKHVAKMTHPRASTIETQVGHVVFVVHGIGESYCKKHLSGCGDITDQTHVMRAKTAILLESHFSDDRKKKKKKKMTHRLALSHDTNDDVDCEKPPLVQTTVEYLPVDWSGVLHDMVSKTRTFDSCIDRFKTSSIYIYIYINM